MAISLEALAAATLEASVGLWAQSDVVQAGAPDDAEGRTRDQQGRFVRRASNGRRPG